jgi:NADPH-dependent 2,4-dienoyl-CoA reductase/sulfur reductase-like enzyme
MVFRRHRGATPVEGSGEPTIRYLVVGGGLAGDAACRGIVDVDPDPGAIMLVAGEVHPPYARPPLSKALWKGAAESTIWRLTANLGIHERLGRRIVRLDLDAHTAIDDRGDGYVYEKVLLATGGRPRRLPFAAQGVTYFRTLDDYHRLRRLADAGARFAVIGGGFVGSEIAAALALDGAPVTMVFPQPGIGARIFPPGLSAALNDYYRGRGVEVLAGSTVTAVERVGDRRRLTLQDGTVLEVDAVVAGLGIEPNVELAAEAGLQVANGIVVDSFGRAGGRDDVFAAGDVAAFPSPVLGGTIRVEHEDHAKSHGRQVGANMAGAAEPYDHLPFFYSDLFDVGYEAVGALDSRLEMLVEVGDVADEGIVYYLDGEQRPRGVLLWNQFGRLDDARALIRAGEPVTAGALGRVAASHVG